jgi:hypothetical protein
MGELMFRLENPLDFLRGFYNSPARKQDAPYVIPTSGEVADALLPLIRDLQREVLDTALASLDTQVKQCDPGDPYDPYYRGLSLSVNILRGEYAKYR